ncbi:hypothetical protein PVK06_014702 [Gossypium arboreum]|uniref:Uncharacterized protein n=1 Tax=Gossypium arboreum TaxID=29729 RepID=A0ABR0PVA2_GOSAR|nr:hypothetical protein PVK06_014702 [Gossypium arboreum]
MEEHETSLTGNVAGGRCWMDANNLQLFRNLTKSTGTTNQMDFSFGEESDLSESEINEYKEKPYEEIRSGKYKLKALSGNLRCPFCVGRKKQDYKGLLQHASGVASEADEISRPALPQVVNQTPEQYVLPWMGIIMNILAESKNVDELRDKGYWLNWFVKYQPSDVKCFWNEEDSTGQAVLTFTSKWVGFLNATEFEKAFESEHHTKKHWNGRQAQLGSNKYGWYARADDYHSDGPVRKVGNYKPYLALSKKPIKIGVMFWQNWQLKLT